MQMFQTGKDRYPSQQDEAYATINQRTLAFIVGLVALGLPTVLLIGAFNPVIDTCFRDSISHFYYAPFWGGPFIGALVFIGTYMFVYQGEDKHGSEARLSNFAGAFAFGVALFPTAGHGCDALSFRSRALAEFAPDPDLLDLIKTAPTDDRPDLTFYFELTSWSATVHYLSATLLFCFLAWFALVVFTAVEEHQRNPDGSLKYTKIVRNRFYRICGAVMILCILCMMTYALLAHLTDLDLSWWAANNMPFWFEATALWAFGISWIVKGRFFHRYLRDEAEQRT
ncbi:MAG: hypothetical protein HKN30_16785 [Sulfitobacter sp.]|nr:hypothetical protein [Sulfitobacter sp.]